MRICACQVVLIARGMVHDRYSMNTYIYNICMGGRGGGGSGWFKAYLRKWRGGGGRDTDSKSNQDKESVWKLFSKSNYNKTL